MTQIFNFEICAIGVICGQTKNTNMGWLIWLMSLFTRIDSGEKFQKATKSDYRFHFFFFATLPLFMLIGEWVLSFIPQSTQSGFPFWLALTVMMVIFVFLILTLAKKTPLFISLPLAVIAWSLFAWSVWKHG
jgi:hypothetical protein